MIKNTFSISNRYLLLVFATCNISFAFAQTFTKITAGPVTNMIGDSRSVNWVDVNNDGWIDLMITNGPKGGQNNFLYINDGAGSFDAISGDSIALDHAPSDGATFADTDNDGDLDCYVANYYLSNNLFYVNDGNANFTRVQDVVTSGGYCETASWEIMIAMDL
ncbi:MAG: VCBS repeat-containing protein [Saprospiraceae bacterium]